LRDPIADCFNLTDSKRNSMSFLNLESYCDVIQSNLFEGLPTCDFTPTQFLQVNQVVLATLIYPMSNPVLINEMFVSKMLRVGLHQMEKVVGGEDIQTKFQIYSAHDYTTAQHPLFMNADNGNFTDVPFASSMRYELHSTKDCTSESCFWVEVYFNDKAYEFSTICANPTKCTYEEFLELLDDRNFVHTETRYRDECATPFVKPFAASTPELAMKYLLYSKVA